MDARQGQPLPTIDVDMVRTNPFRVLGLAPSASPAEIRRRTEQAVAACRLGAARPFDAILPLTSAPDEHQLRDAAHRLRDPMGRLIAEVFWFEPDPGPTPGAWHLDRPTSVGALKTAWTKLATASDDGARRSAAAHNLAVLHLVLLAEARPDGDPSVPKEAWTQAPEYWLRWLADDAAARKVADRLAELGPPGPSGSGRASVVHRSRRDLTRSMLRPLVDLALERLEDGDSYGANRLLALAAPRPGRPPSDAVSPELRRLARRAEEKVLDLTGEAWARAQADQKNATAVGARLHQDARRWFDVLADAPTDAVDGPPVVAPEDVNRVANRFADILAACGVNFLDPDDPLDVQEAALGLVRAASEIVRDPEASGEIAGMLDALQTKVEHLRRTRQAQRDALARQEEKARQAERAWRARQARAAEQAAEQAAAQARQAQQARRARERREQEERSGRGVRCFQCGWLWLQSGGEPRPMTLSLTWGEVWRPPPEAKVRALGLTPGRVVPLTLQRCERCHREARRAHHLLRLVAVAIPFVLVLGGVAAAKGGVLPLLALVVAAAWVSTLFIVIGTNQRLTGALTRHPAVAQLIDLGYVRTPGWRAKQFPPEGAS